MKKICVIGIGYVGLPTAAMFASCGHEVIGYDLNEKAVAALNRGEIIIEEPHLPELVKKVVEDGRLKATTQCPKDCDVYIIAVPTPVNHDKTANMSYVDAAARAIVPNLTAGNIVILESTSPPRTVLDLICPILSESGLNIGEDVLVAHSPERVLPGKILQELKSNGRIVGGINQKSSEEVKKIYEAFVEGEIVLTDATTAEMCKLMENTFRDVNIALANELAKISEQLGVNAWEVIELSNMHPRVNILSPGPGVGGHCIALDPWFLVEKSDNAKLIKQSRLINDSMPEFTLDKIKRILNGVSGKTVTVLGVTYKPDIDDVRESPIMNLVSLLEKEGATVKIYDPHAKDLDKNCTVLEEAVKGSSLAVMGVNHSEFKSISLKALSKLMEQKNVLDTRNFWDRQEAEEAGLNYYLLGKFC